MIITIVKVLADNRYTSTISTSGTEQELALVEKFGEPTVNIGGSFTGPPSFSEPDSFKKIFNGFPRSFSKDADGDVLAKEKVVEWSDELVDRLTDAITDLRGQTDDFSKETIVTV